MSLAQELKNYLNFLTTVIDDPSVHFSSIRYIKYHLFYIVTLLKNGFLYIFSLTWIHDFLELPNILPSWPLSTLTEIFTFQNPNNLMFEYPPNEFQFHHPFDSLFCIAFLTSFFYWIPHSSIQILILRRFIVEGIPAGVAASLGTFCAQFIFLFCILFGIRKVLFPWLAVESVTYLIGLLLLCLLVYKLAHSSVKRIRFTDHSALIRIFFMNFLLVGCEIYGLSPYIYSLNSIEHSIVYHLNTITSKGIYLLGFTFGSTFWAIVFGFIFLKLSQVIVNQWIKSYSNWIQRANFICLSCILSFSIASIPYYGLDYLVLASLGFHSNEPSMKQLELKTDIKDVSKGRLGEYSAHSSIDTDIAPYDKGRYSTGSEIELTFEDLNFQGEYIWRARADRLASGSAGIVNKFMSKFLPQSHKTRSTEANPILTSTSNQIQLTAMDDPNSIFESLFNRFLSDYQAEVIDSTLPESNLESDQFSAFSELVKYGFDSFASLEDIESDEFEEELGKKIKYKYYNNPIYQFILCTDLNHFLNRQPKMHFLTQMEENQLFLKKQILTNYYNSLRYYAFLPYTKIFKNLFGPTKSYANRVYNQQYKGTLKILRRLFLVDFQPNLNEKTVLKFDQLLYKEKKQNPYIHEELRSRKKRTKRKTENY